MIRRTMRLSADRPTLYLFDEYHHCNQCTDENIAEARSLIQSGVGLVCVEGVPGGLVYNHDGRTYTDQKVESSDSLDLKPISDYQRFAEGVRDIASAVVGVDCEGLCLEVELDSVYRQINGRHPNHERRSLHFLRTMQEEIERRDYKGDVILNCGSAHVDDVERALMNFSALPQGWPDMSYIRLTSPSFEECAKPETPSSRFSDA